MSHYIHQSTLPTTQLNNNIVMGCGIIAFIGFNVYMFVSLMRVYVVYIVKEVASFRGFSQLMGVTRKKGAFELQTSRKNVKPQLILITAVYSRETV